MALSMLLIVLLGAPAIATEPGSTESRPADIVGERNFLTGYPPVNDDGTVHVVIECPAGTTAKWEVDPDGVLRRQYAGTVPKTYRYLPFPVNYGMIPGTELAREIGGEGEPLDVLVLSEALPAGTVVRARVIGVLVLLDGGEQDDKVVTVLDGPPFGDVLDIEDLDQRFPGVTAIIETWFLNSKPKEYGEIQSFGYVGAGAGMRLIRAGVAAFAKEAGS